MKIKRFNNLWTMGLIILVGILVTIYCVKIINPTFIVGVAETESIVKVGQFIDSHKWAYYIITTLVSFVVYWLFCCASCRKSKLNWKENLVIVITIIILFICEKYFSFMYYEINMLSMIIVPAIILKMNNQTSIKYLYSVITCTTINFISQALSLQIRNIGLMIASYNYATLIVLLIDAYIWLFVLYCYFNIKKEVK